MSQATSFYFTGMYCILLGGAPICLTRDGPTLPCGQVLMFIICADAAKRSLTQLACTIMTLTTGSTSQNFRMSFLSHGRPSLDHSQRIRSITRVLLFFRQSIQAALLNSVAKNRKHLNCQVPIESIDPDHRALED